jgi:hypothetical protein
MFVSEIITAAFREGNLIPVGTDPTAAERAEALGRFNNFVAALFGFELGELLTDWTVPPPQRNAPVAAQYPLAPAAHDLPSDVWPYPPSNTRLLFASANNLMVYLQQNPHDGAQMAYVDVGQLGGVLTLNGNGRLVDGTSTLVLSADPTRLFYRADLADWIVLATLAETDSSPLPAEFDDLLITGLSIRLSPRFGNDPREGTVATYTSMRTKLIARYRQPTAALGNAADTPRTQQSYIDSSDPWM